LRQFVTVSIALMLATASWLPSPAAVQISSPLSKKQVTSKFGPRIHPITGKASFHAGLDLAASLNQRVKSVVDGVVTRAGRRGGLGNAVEVLNRQTQLKTIYGHLNKIAVRKGQKVRAGDVVGYAGSTGRSTGVHLHLVTKDASTGRLLNPASLLAQGHYGKRHQGAVQLASNQANKKRPPRPQHTSRSLIAAAPAVKKPNMADLNMYKKQLAQAEINLQQAEQSAKIFASLYEEGAVSRNDATAKQMAASAAHQQVASLKTRLEKFNT
jgi:hypothetical protein